MCFVLCLSDVTGNILGVIVVSTVMIALLLAVVLMRNDKTTWVYIVKKIRGPPIPNPAVSFLQDINFETKLSPHFNSASFHHVLKPMEIIPVEVTSIVDAVAPCMPERPPLEKMKCESSSDNLNSSSFSNPSYSHLCPLPPASSLTAGNLEPCAADTPYGPVGSQGQGLNAEQDKEEKRMQEVKFLQFLSKGRVDSKTVQVISDYEKAEKLQVERIRLQSLDSGVCSGEEVSQESLEADSISVTDNHDEGPKGCEVDERWNGKEVHFQKLFSSSGGAFAKGSIQVCSDYECVQKLQPTSPELPSLDSGVSSGSEEQVSQEEGLEDVDNSTETTSFLFPPPSSCPLPCSLPSFPQPPSKFSGPGESPALQALPSHLLGMIALMSASRSVEPSGDGYMPVRQEQG